MGGEPGSTSRERGTDPWVANLTIPASHEAGAIARRTVARWIGEHPRLGDALLALTELVNNAVLHGGLGPGDRLTITMTPERDGIRLAVRHRGVLFSAHQWRDLSREPGASRGLGIVHRVADEWGVDSDGAEVSAWFELPRLEGER